jgi:hypothetical protein
MEEFQSVPDDSIISGPKLENADTACIAGDNTC